jgi:mRNA interferase HigB
MQLLGRRRLGDCKRKYSDLRKQIDLWEQDIKGASYSTPLELANAFSNGDSISADRVVFDMKGGKYRLVVRVDYCEQTVEVRFCGTHAEYDRIDALTV